MLELCSYLEKKCNIFIWIPVKIHMKTQNTTFNILKKRGTQKWPKIPSNRWFASISVDPVSQKRIFLCW